VVFAQGRKLEGTGIIPDQLVTPTMFDLQRGRDAVLAAADKSLVKAAVLESKETHDRTAPSLDEKADAQAESARLSRLAKIATRTLVVAVALAAIVYGADYGALRCVQHTRASGRLRFGAHDAAVGHTIEKRPHRI